MTTFTRLPDDAPAVIEVDAARTLSRIDPMIYGGFLEHMGRCIYGGIYEPGSPLSDARGFRTDVLAALRELDVPVMRYPGGNFVATYHWEDGIGAVDQRPARPELAWGGTETNRFGTDEFMAWLDALSEGRPKRVEPFLVFNMATGTLAEALAWVEYCNGTGDTHYANLRRRNGHAEPYGVKYWALGNEVYGDWQVGQMTRERYAEEAAQWAKAVRMLDPSVVLVLCGLNGLSAWDAHVLGECAHVVDMHSIHMYTFGGHDSDISSSSSNSTSENHMANVTAPRAAERAIRAAAALAEVARVDRSARLGRNLSRVEADRPPLKICLDEWNVWDMAGAPGDRGAEQTYTLSDALAVGAWLNVLVRQSRLLGMANIAQSVNVISPLTTSKEGLVKQATWWPLLLASRYMRGSLLGVHVACGAYDGATNPGWLRAALREEGGVPLLDVAAVLGEDGLVSLMVVNICQERDTRATVRGICAPAEGFVVTGTDVGVTNGFGREDGVTMKEFKWEGDDEMVSFPKHSVMLLRWRPKASVT